MDSKKVFIDGISEIEYICQVARMKTYTLTRNNAGNEQEYTVNPEVEIITSLDGFCNCFNTMKTVMEKLVKEGIVKESIFDRVNLNEKQQ